MFKRGNSLCSGFCNTGNNRISENRAVFKISRSVTLEQKAVGKFILHVWIVKKGRRVQNISDKKPSRHYYRLYSNRFFDIVEIIGQIQRGFTFLK